jgi:hypothetical protein
MPLPIDMTEEQLLEVLHGPLGATTSYGTAAYTEELNRRNIERQTRDLIDLSTDIRTLTCESRTLARPALYVAAAALVKSGSSTYWVAMPSGPTLGECLICRCRPI